MNRSRLLLLLSLLILVAGFFAFGLQRYFTLDFIKAQQAAIADYHAGHPVAAGVIYALIYVVITGLSLPGATVLTLAGGAVFGLWWGTLIVSFASSLGATVAFLAARFLFQEAVAARFGRSLNAINAGLARDGWRYLFTLRLVPLFPFFMINLAMGLTALPVFTFYWVSQVGMLAGTLVYVNAGMQLAQIRSPGDILSPGLLLSFALLGSFPWIARAGVERFKTRQLYARWPKPGRFDRNLIVIGAGAAGLVAAYLAASTKAKVTLIEKHRMGGDCLNTGCVPSKALIRTARLLAQIRQAPEFGILKAEAEFDFAFAMERVRKTVEHIAPHDSVERYTQLGVEVIEGEAKIASPWAVEVATASGTQTLTTRAIVIAAGARPWVPDIPGLEETGYLTSDTVWDLRELPRRLLVLGGGAVGCELAQCFARFGSQVAVVERLPQLLAREDPEVSECIARRFQEEGVDLRLGHKAKRAFVEDGEKFLVVEQEGRESRLPFDQILVAVGRVANTQGYGLEELGIIPPSPSRAAPGAQGSTCTKPGVQSSTCPDNPNRASPALHSTASRTIETNRYLQTLYPNIYACGDVAGPLQFTHAAAHQAWHAAVNALLGGIWRFPVEDAVIPWAVFTDPEVARVGLSEQDAKARNIAYDVSRFDLAGLDRAIVESRPQGFVKVLTAAGSGQILGATIVGEQAGELITEFASAMQHGIALGKILATVHAYPTLSEANQRAAGVWRRAHTSARLLDWAERYHAWRRG